MVGIVEAIVDKIMEVISPTSQEMGNASCTGDISTKIINK